MLKRCNTVFVITGVLALLLKLHVIIHCPLLGEAEREYQSKCVQVLDDQASSTNVDNEEVISHQEIASNESKETASNESIVEINDSEDSKQGN